MDTGDTAWVLMCAALVMFMTPGLALFYGGLVRTKNVLGTIMQSFFALALVTVLWTLIGYTLAFGRDVGGVIGGLSFLGLNDVGLEPSETYGTTVPHLAFSTYQLMFAIITPALITGAVAERMRFSAYALFLGLWSILVYAPVAHWVFADGWLGLSGVGALDFAGGTVVHINAGAAALAAIVFLGKRRGFGRQAFIPHDVPMVILGASILWFGWFGFNAGSALGANGLAASAFTVTNLATAAAVLGWLLFERVKHGRATTIGAATGAVAGLVAITPAAGFVEPWAAIVIGFAAGAVCFFVVNLKARIGYDDSLDVVGVHLVGGIVGALFTGVFASAAVNGFSGGLVQLGRQALAVGATMAFSFAMTLGILKVVDMLVGVRVSEEEELTGLDLSQHSEVAYTSSEGSGALAGQQDTVIAVPETPTPAVPAYRETRIGASTKP
ncbi:MAG TPA: ammonium transporter [Actinomycetota bacterium]|nr:ammonium transporter [Actinomycetota bacterium]